MQLSRRAALAAALCGVSAWPANATGFAMLHPGIASAIGFVPLAGGRLAFRVAGLDPGIELPAPRARVAALLPIAERQVAVLAFGADPPRPAARLDLAAVVGWDGTRLRVLALEVLTWQTGDGGRLDTRFAATGDRRCLTLTRDCAARRDARRWRRESWIDLLAWQEGAALRDTPARSPVPETWQAQLAPVRERVAARLAAPCSDVGEALIRLLSPETLPPG